MLRTGRRFHWLWIALSVIMPLVLYRVLAERASWRPRTIYQTESTDGTLVMAFSPDGHTLAISQTTTPDDDGIALYDLDTSTIRTLHQSNTCSAIAYSPDGKTLAGAGADEGQVRLWDVQGGGLRRFLNCDQMMDGASALAVAFSPDGKTVAAGLDTGVALLWDPATGHLKHALWSGRKASFNRTQPEPMVSTIAFSPDSRTLATGGDWDDSIKLWDVRTGQLRQTWRGHTGPVDALTFSPQGDLLASGSSYETTRLWALPSGRVLHVLSNAGYVCGTMSFSPDGKLLMTSGTQVRVWTMPEGRLRSTLKVNGPYVSVSPDGKTLATTNIQPINGDPRTRGLFNTTNTPQVGNAAVTTLIWDSDEYLGEV